MRDLPNDVLQGRSLPRETTIPPLARVWAPVALVAGCLLMGACDTSESGNDLAPSGRDGQAATGELGSVRDGLDAQPLDLGWDAQRDKPAPVGCVAGSRNGASGRIDGLVKNGIGYTVRTPATYDPTVAHPLLVVYSRGGVLAHEMEEDTELTEIATGRGYVITYVDHISPANIGGVDVIARLPAEIAKSWCIDARRIYLTGHSDGGTVIYLMMARQSWTLPPAAIAPSAAGVSADFLVQMPCPKEVLPVMVLHSSEDKLFPGFGREARDYWIKCMGCGAAQSVVPDNCTPYGDCTDQLELRYCEGERSHGKWPKNNNGPLLDFFGRQQRP